MAKRPTSLSPQVAVHVGGAAVGSALAAGDGNVQTVTFTAGDPLNDDRIEVLSALSEIRAALDGLGGPHAGTAKREADAALSAASAEAPDKDAVGGALEGALGAALKTVEFGNAVAKLAPHLRTVASWLGGQWTRLVDMVL